MAPYPPSFTVYINSTSAIHAASLSISMIHKSWPGGRSSFSYFIYIHIPTHEISCCLVAIHPVRTFFTSLEFVSAFRPREVFPCNVDQETWIQWGPTPIAGLWAASFLYILFFLFIFVFRGIAYWKSSPGRLGNNWRTAGSDAKKAFNIYLLLPWLILYIYLPTPWHSKQISIG